MSQIKVPSQARHHKQEKNRENIRPDDRPDITVKPPSQSGQKEDIESDGGEGGEEAVEGEEPHIPQRADKLGADTLEHPAKDIRIDDERVRRQHINRQKNRTENTENDKAGEDRLDSDGKNLRPTE